MQKPYLLTLLISLCLLQGCVTRYQSQPEVNGQLLDNANYANRQRRQRGYAV